MKVYEGPIGAYFSVTAHLTNLVTIMRGMIPKILHINPFIQFVILGGNQISYHFGSDVPSMSSYLRGFE